jgi:hypothetical protein
MIMFRIRGFIRQKDKTPAELRGATQQEHMNCSIII